MDGREIPCAAHARGVSQKGRNLKKMLANKLLSNPYENEKNQSPKGLQKRRKKEIVMKKITIVLLFGFLVVLNPGCKSGKDFDITGTWVITTRTADGQSTGTITFTGTKTEGSVTLEGGAFYGSYTVVGDTVQFSITGGFAGPLWWQNYTGQLDGGDAMGGNFNTTLDGAVIASGTWAGRR